MQYMNLCLIRKILVKSFFFSICTNIYNTQNQKNYHHIIWLMRKLVGLDNFLKTVYLCKYKIYGKNSDNSWKTVLGIKMWMWKSDSKTKPLNSKQLTGTYATYRNICSLQGLKYSKSQTKVPNRYLLILIIYLDSYWL